MKFITYALLVIVVMLLLLGIMIFSIKKEKYKLLVISGTLISIYMIVLVIADVVFHVFDYLI